MKETTSRFTHSFFYQEAFAMAMKLSDQAPSFFRIKDPTAFSETLKSIEKDEEDVIRELEKEPSNNGVYQSSSTYRKSHRYVVLTNYRRRLQPAIRTMNRLIVIDHRFYYKPIKAEAYPQVYLSYTYDDRALAMGLYFHCLENGIYLFVDALHDGKLRGKEIPKTILPYLDASKQLLFILSPSSQIATTKAVYMKPWCAWEIGAFSKGNGVPRTDNTFYMTFKDTPSVIEKGGLIENMRPLLGIWPGQIY